MLAVGPQEIESGKFRELSNDLPFELTIYNSRYDISAPIAQCRPP